MRRAFALVAVTTAASLVAVSAVSAVHADSESTFEFAYQSASSVQSVSPDVVVANGTYYLFTTGMGGIGVYTSSNGETWTQVTSARTPTGPVSDPSVVQLADGTYRMYYTSRSGMGGPACSGKELRYATSTDLTAWTTQSAVLLADLGCGVPDVIRDGSSFNLYYVRGKPVEHGIYMATSPDGLTWTTIDGIRAPKDFVDPSVVKVRDGHWLMMVADFPAGPPTPGFLQRLYVGTSTDGRTWDFGDRQPVYAPSGLNALDPNLNLMADGTFKVWFAQGASAEAATVAYGILTEDAPEPTPVLVPPTKPTLVLTKSRATISWQFPVGATTPSAFVIERKSGNAWVAVGEVAADKRTFATTVRALGGSAGKSVTVRVVATLGDQRAESPSSTARVPKR